jgi:hypothetical protein
MRKNNILPVVCTFGPCAANARRRMPAGECPPGLFPRRSPTHWPTRTVPTGVSYPRPPSGFLFGAGSLYPRPHRGFFRRWLAQLTVLRPMPAVPPGSITNSLVRNPSTWPALLLAKSAPGPTRRPTEVCLAWRFVWRGARVRNPSRQALDAARVEPKTKPPRRNCLGGPSRCVAVRQDPAARVMSRGTAREMPARLRRALRPSVRSMVGRRSACERALTREV